MEKGPSLGHSIPLPAIASDFGLNVDEAERPVPGTVWIHSPTNQPFRGGPAFQPTSSPDVVLHDLT